jgi:hypothetical protein
VIVPRLMVRVDAKLGDIVSGQEMLKDGPMRGTSTFVYGSKQEGFAFRKQWSVRFLRGRFPATRASRE